MIKTLSIENEPLLLNIKNKQMIKYEIINTNHHCRCFLFFAFLAPCF